MTSCTTTILSQCTSVQNYCALPWLYGASAFPVRVMTSSCRLRLTCIATLLHLAPGLPSIVAVLELIVTEYWILLLQKFCASLSMHNAADLLPDYNNVSICVFTFAYRCENSAGYSFCTTHIFRRLRAISRSSPLQQLKNRDHFWYLFAYLYPWNSATDLLLIVHLKVVNVARHRRSRRRVKNQI